MNKLPLVVHWQLILGGQSSGKIYLKHPKKRTRGETVDKDHKEIAKLLGALGKFRIASNINQLAKTANSGSLPVSALQEKGYYLARDNRHGYVAVMQLFAAKT